MANPKIRTFVADGPGDVPDDSGAVEFELPPLDADLAARLAETHQRLAAAAPTVTTSPPDTAQLAIRLGVTALGVVATALDTLLNAATPEAKARLLHVLAEFTREGVRARIDGMAAAFAKRSATIVDESWFVDAMADLAKSLEDPN